MFSPLPFGARIGARLRQEALHGFLADQPLGDNKTQGSDGKKGNAQKNLEPFQTVFCFGATKAEWTSEWRCGQWKRHGRFGKAHGADESTR